MLLCLAYMLTYSLWFLYLYSFFSKFLQLSFLYCLQLEDALSSCSTALLSHRRGPASWHWWLFVLLYLIPKHLVWRGMRKLADNDYFQTCTSVLAGTWEKTCLQPGQCCMCCSVSFSIKQELLLVNYILTVHLYHFFFFGGGKEQNSECNKCDCIIFDVWIHLMVTVCTCMLKHSVHHGKWRLW